MAPYDTYDRFPYNYDIFYDIYDMEELKIDQIGSMRCLWGLRKLHERFQVKFHEGIASKVKTSVTWVNVMT